MKKLLYVCLDGLGDDPIPEFDGRTPLEAAPHARPRRAGAPRVARASSSPSGTASRPSPTSPCSRSSGYDPREEHPGRGVVEAVGVGMDFRDGDLAYRVNFATGEWPEIVDRRVGRDLSVGGGARARRRGERATGRLPGATFTLRATVEHRGVAGDPRRRRAAVGRGDEHRSRVPQGRVARRGARDVRADRRAVRAARRTPRRHIARPS